jgi:hypothetical protein
MVYSRCISSSYILAKLGLTKEPVVSNAINAIRLQILD